MTVKLRVMPKCWLVLVRLWIRVDGLMVRLRESRLFCRHDTPAGALTVLRETKHAEGTFKALRAAGAPDVGPAYADADAASQALQAVAPVGVTAFKTDKLLLPS
jgi:type 2A phosphatase activator TIP41